MGRSKIRDYTRNPILGLRVSFMFLRACPSCRVLLRAVITSVCLAVLIPSFAWSATAKLKARFEIVQSLSVQHESAPSYSALQVPEASVLDHELECYLNPETNHLSGKACVSETGASGVTMLTGSQHQSVAIRVNGSENELLRYAPEFFDDENEHYDDFVVPSANYPIKIGGTLTVRSPVMTSSATSDQAVFYALEIAYP